MDLGLRGARAAYCRGRPAPILCPASCRRKGDLDKRRGVIKSMILRVLHRHVGLRACGATASCRVPGTGCCRGSAPQRSAYEEEWQVTNPTRRASFASCRQRAHNVHFSMDPHPLITTAQLTCPVCGHVSSETMPLDACIYYHDCAGCGTLLRPRAGDCCVFCSYGTVPCPPVQAQQPCCGTHRKP